MDPKQIQFKVKNSKGNCILIDICKDASVDVLKDKIELAWHIPKEMFELICDSQKLSYDTLISSLPKAEAMMIQLVSKKPSSKHRFAWIALGVAVAVAAIFIGYKKMKKQSIIAL